MYISTSFNNHISEYRYILIYPYPISLLPTWTFIEYYVGYNLQPWNIRHITIGHKISNIIPMVHFEILGKLSHHVSLKLYPSYKDMMDPITSIHCEKGYRKFILWNVHVIWELFHYPCINTWKLRQKKCLKICTNILNTS